MPELSIQRQMEIADIYLELLRKSGINCAVAGGAPRDWRLGFPAKDIDIFIFSGTNKEDVESAIGSKISSVGEDMYGDTDFKVYHVFTEDQQEVQFILTNVDSVEKVVEGFPISTSKAIYYGEGGFWFHNRFVLSARFGHLIEDNGGANDKLLEKSLLSLERATGRQAGLFFPHEFIRKVIGGLNLCFPYGSGEQLRADEQMRNLIG